MSKNTAVAIAACMSAQAWNEGKILPQYVPERRPPEKIMGPDI